MAMQIDTLTNADIMFPLCYVCTCIRCWAASRCTTLLCTTEDTVLAAWLLGWVSM